MRRPLFWFTVHFLAVVALTLWLGKPAGMIATCAGVICCTLLPGAKARRGLTLCLAASLALGLGVVSLTHERLRYWQQSEGQTLPFTGWVEEQNPYNVERVTVRGTVLREDGPQTVTLDLTGTGDLFFPGQWITGGIRVLEARQDGEALGGVSLFGVAAAETTEVIPEPEGFHPLARLAAVRQELSGKVRQQDKGEAAALVAAMLFSRPELLGQETLGILNRAGIRHLIVVSGLHLSILVGWIRAVCRGMKLGERSAGVLSLAAVWLMVGLAGASVSVLRAAAAVSLWLAGQCLGRRSDGLTSLAAAALVLTVAAPAVVFGTGWQLTFAATLGILLGGEPLARWMQARWESRFGGVGGTVRWLSEGLAATLCAQVAVMPILALNFGVLSAWGVLTNLLVMVFISGVLLAGGLGALLLFLGASGAAGVLLAAARCPAWCILAIAKGIALLPWGMVPVRFTYELALCFVLPVVVLGAAQWAGRTKPGRIPAVCGGALAVFAAMLLWSRAGCRGAVLAGTDRRTGAAMVSTGAGTVAVAAGEGRFAWWALEDRLLRSGTEGPLVLVFPADVEFNEVLWWAWNLDPEAVVVPGEFIHLLNWQRPGQYFAESADGAEVLPGVRVTFPQADLICIDAEGKRVVGCRAGYGVITEADLPPETDLLVDMDGRVYPLTQRMKLMWAWEGLAEST